MPDTSRTVPLTVLTPLRRGGALAVRVAFATGDQFPFLLDRLRALSFLHFATWSIVSGSGRRRRGVLRQHLASDYLLFESDFDGDWDDYLDAFAQVMPLRIRAIWGSSHGFPGPVPTPAFRAYVRRNEVCAAAYYSAYPSATTSDVLQALRLARRFEDHRDGLRSPDGLPCAEQVQAFLTTVQRDL